MIQEKCYLVAKSSQLVLQCIIPALCVFQEQFEHYQQDHLKDMSIHVGDTVHRWPGVVLHMDSSNSVTAIL